jgi:hypothetical protein
VNSGGIPKKEKKKETQHQAESEEMGETEGFEYAFQPRWNNLAGDGTRFMPKTSC